MDLRKTDDDIGIALDENQEENNKVEWFDIDSTEPRKNERSPSMRPISKTMLISEIVDEHPDIIPEIMNMGMHCVGCGASSLETLEEGFMMHGMDPEEIEKMVSELNKIIDQNSKPVKRPESDDDFYL